MQNRRVPSLLHLLCQTLNLYLSFEFPLTDEMKKPVLFLFSVLTHASWLASTSVHIGHLEPKEKEKAV